MVNAIRTTEKAMGKINYAITPEEAASRVFRRSLFVVKDMKADEKFTEVNVRSIRPGYGLPTRYLSSIIGRKSVKNIKMGTPLSWDLVK